MGDRNRKLKKQSAHRDRASGSSYFSVKHSLKPEQAEVSEKKMRSLEIKEEKKTRAERKARVGKPQAAFLGNRTRTEKGRVGYSTKNENRLSQCFEWGDRVVGKKYFIPEFSGESSKPHLTLIVRVFLQDNFDFYDHEWRNMILKYLIKTYRLSSNEVLASLKTRLLSIKNNKDYMTRAINRFGPAFLPKAFVVVNGTKEFIHNIPIKNGSLLRAQQKFQEKQFENVLEAHALMMGEASPLIVSSLNGAHGEFTNSDDVNLLTYFSVVDLIQMSMLMNDYSFTTLVIAAIVLYFYICDLRSFSRILGRYLTAILMIPIFVLSCLVRTSVLLMLPIALIISLLLSVWVFLLFLKRILFPGTVYVAKKAIQVNKWTVEQIFAQLRGGARSIKKMERKNANLMKKGFLKSKHLGSGGKSKKRDIPVSDEPPPDSDLNSVSDDGEQNWDKKVFIDEFRYSKTPNIQTTHFPKPTYQNFVDFDCHGAPFCGLTCIDVALGILPKPDVYCQMARHMGDVFDLGTVESVAAYSHYRGCNLKVLTPVFDENGEVQVLNYESCNNPQWRWIVLKLSGPGGRLYDPVVDRVGHYTLCCNDRADCPNVEVPMVDTSSFVKSIIMFLKYHRAVHLPSFLLLINEVRTIIQHFGHHNDRDAVEFMNRVLDDNHFPSNADLLLAWANICMSLAINNGLQYRWRFRCKSFNRNNDDVRSIEERSEPFMCQDYYGHFDECISYYFLGFPLYDLYRRDRVVSVVRCVKALKEAQFLGTEDLNRVFFGIFRGNICNTNDSIPFIHNDTQCYVRYLLAMEGYSRESYYQKLTIAYNDCGAGAYIGNIPNVAANQQLRGGANHIKKLKKLNAKSSHDTKKRKIIAYAPIGAIETEKGTIGPGLFCRTEYFSLIAAFCGRSMQRINNFNQELVDYIKFSKEFIRSFVNRVDLTGIVETNPEVYFPELYKGKKTQNWIQSKLKDYTNFKSGVFSKKFVQHSCFVKKEDSRKNVKGQIRLKPRLIMTMSDKSLIETCQIMKVIHAWCLSPFSKYQVKNLLPSEFVGKIQKFTESSHIVTDYSSFEASVHGAIRDIEHYFVRALCLRAGLNNTWNSYKNNFMKSRNLHSRAGVFSINSRCSGDFMTSVGNGIQNICLSAYCHFKNFGNLDTFEIIAEGDDGLVRGKSVNNEVLDNLGFSFSSSLKGTLPGDVDFLRCRWMLGCCFLNVGRVLKNIFWVKPKSDVGPNVLLQLLKCMALSLHATSPGHPILYEVVNRIMRATLKVVVNQKTIMHHFGWYKVKNIDFDANLKLDRVCCKEVMRGPLARGAAGFPPIPICVQLELERRLRDDNLPFYIGDLLDSYEDISDMKKTQIWGANHDISLSPEMNAVVNLMKN